jgi:CHAT domain-containing protein
MKKITFIIFISSFIIHHSSFSQNQNKIDSLNTLLQNAKEDTNKVNHLLAIGDEYENNQPKKAVDYYKQALESAKQINNPAFMANCLEKLGIIFSKSIEKYDTAEIYYLECLKIHKEYLGETHPSYVYALNNLASLYQVMGNYAAAEPLFIEVKNIDKKVLGEKHLNYASSLLNLANLYIAMGNYSAAEPLFIEAKNIYKEVLGEKHSSYVSSLDNLAGLYCETGNYQVAEPLIQEEKNIRREVLGAKHPSYAISILNLANLYNAMGNYSAASYLYLEYLKIVNEAINQNFVFLSEKEKEMYFKTKAGYFEGFYSFSLKKITKTKDYGITKSVYNNVLKNKGLFLKSATAMRTAILKSNDTNLIAEYEKWIKLKKEISKLYSTEISKRKKNPEELEKEANIIERNLLRGSQVFSDYKKLQNLTWENVKKSLKPGEAAIEFIRFAEGKKRDSTFYCALIITHQSKQPEMIKLFYEKDLQLILGTNITTSFSYIKRIYGTRQNSNERLYKLIWQPMEKNLEGIKTVYYSPDGLLHKVSFSSIGKEKDLLLCDIYSLFRLNSTGKVAMPESFSLGQDFEIGIFGGMEYSTDSTTNNIWQYLPGTKNETDKIDQIFKAKEIKSAYLTGKNAGEKIFKETAGTCNLLHIATHGFFYPEPVVIKNEVSESQPASRSGINCFGEWQFEKNMNPLMRSGLVFAGANIVWSQRFVSEAEDGMLTAQEVTQLDLQKTQLVVMSACETGLGDIKGSEGVYGLQRAFKMAGVKFLIMSLWQVPDNETSEFMTKFYEKLLITKNIKKSFNETQSELRKKYDPFYWAAFVLIE